MKIHSIWDIGEDKEMDRYTVYFTGKNKVNGLYDCLGMSDNPTSPLGYCQHGMGLPGKHNGKKIKLEDLPKACQEIVKKEIAPKPAIKTYPELTKIAKDLSTRVAMEVNSLAEHVQSEMPYKARFILEELINFLEEKV